MTSLPKPCFRTDGFPDPGRKYDGRQVNNIRKALRDHPAVHRFIRASDRCFEVLNAGDRATQIGLLRIPKDEIRPVMLEMEAAMQELTAAKAGRNDPCPCGSGKKYTRCCGQ